MRGQLERTDLLFSCLSTVARIPPSHRSGSPSIPPEQLLLVLLLQAIYGSRSEGMLMEQPDHYLLLCWFVGLNPDAPVWHPTTYGLRPTSLLPKTVTDS